MSNVYALMESATENTTIVAKNGELVDGYVKSEIMSIFNESYEKINDEVFESEFLTFFSDEKLYYCSIFHDEKDQFGRTRLCIFIWEESSTDDEIKKTADIMGANFAKIQILKAKYEANPKKQDKKYQKSKKNLVPFLVAIVAAIGTIGVVSKNSNPSLGIISALAVGIGIGALAIFAIKKFKKGKI